ACLAALTAAAGIGAAGRASAAAAAIRPTAVSMSRAGSIAAEGYEPRSAGPPDADQVAAALGRPERRRRILGGGDALAVDLQDDVPFAHAGRCRRAAVRDLRDDGAARPAFDP